MPEQIVINREWLTRLVKLVDKLASEEDDISRSVNFGHLLGYVHSLDESDKKEIIK